MTKKRRDYVYVASRATKEDEACLTRNWKDDCQFIIRRKGSGFEPNRYYLWVDKSKNDNSPKVVLESHYVGGRNFHYQGSEIFKACEQAIKRLLKEEKEQK